jgi:copper chaperone CopZ
MKRIQLILAFCAIAMISFANDPGEITVKSSVVCDMCKETIEEGLAFEKGVKQVRVDVDANTIYVKFNEKHLNEGQVKTLITKLGYAADDMKPVKEAYDNLHGCCKAPGACEDKK